MKFEDKLNAGGNGCLHLENATFNNETFEQFALRPAVGTTATLVNVQLVGCRITPGTCLIREGAILRDVLFDEFECGDAMHINAEAFLERVVIKGRRSPKRVEIKPHNDDRSGLFERYGDIDLALDLSDFYGEVSVIGVPADKVKINPDQHVRIMCDRFDNTDLKALGIGGLSYWKLIAGKVAGAGVREGVFSLPSKKVRNYEKSMNELKKLVEAGVI